MHRRAILPFIMWVVTFAGITARPCRGAVRMATQLYTWMVEFQRKGEDPEAHLGEILAEVRASGFRAVEGWLRFFATDEKAERFRASLDRHGLALVSVYASGDLHHAGKAEPTIARILEWAARARGFPGLAVNFSCATAPGKSEEELERQARSVVKLAEGLGGLGMSLMLHNHTEEMAGDMREFRYMLEHTPRGRVGFCLDLDWAARAGADPLEAIRAAKGRIAAVHLRNTRGEVHTAWLGEGDIDYRRVAAALRLAGFGGLLTLELIHDPATPGKRSVAEDVARSRALMEGLFLLEVGAVWDSHGGWSRIRRAPTGFFYAEQVGGRWWLIDPVGNAFFSKGVNHVSFRADVAPKLGHSPYERKAREKYGSVETWAEASVGRLRRWGFNTIGAWSSPETFEQRMPYTVILNLAAAAGADWWAGRFPDVFAEAFREAIERRAEKLCAPRAADPLLIGYFTDNELRWGADWRSKRSLLADYLDLPPDRAGKEALVAFLIERHGSVQGVGKAWGIEVRDREALAALRALPARNDAIGEDETAFLRHVAAGYFRTCREAIRRFDPNHLILGCRFAGYAPPPVLEGARGWVDVVSYNHYGERPPARKLEEVHRRTGAPVMLTEFSFKAMDSGLPNTRGAGRPVATQADRARLFRGYVEALADLPFVVGYHWFEYVDEPAEGRFDGENSNYGLVTIRDEPWTVLVERMQEVNRTIEARHARAAPRPGR